MNPANFREALVEAHEDESEGADILLVGFWPLSISNFITISVDQMLCNFACRSNLVCRI